MIPRQLQDPRAVIDLKLQQGTGRNLLHLAAAADGVTGQDCVRVVVQRRAGCDHPHLAVVAAGVAGLASVQVARAAHRRR